MLVKSDSFNMMATDIASVMVNKIAETIKNLKPNACPKNPKIKKLLNSLQVVERHVNGSDASLQAKRSKILLISYKHGTPHVYFTLNLAVVHHSLVQFLAREDVNLEEIMQSIFTYPTLERWAANIATNPYAVAKFFKHFVEAFVKGFIDEGLFGKVWDYYRNVET